MSYCQIYVISNNINSKVYIGQTWGGLSERLRRHIGSWSGCIRLRNAIQKYGKDQFHIRLLTVCHTQEVADYWESYFIQKYDTVNNGYNLTTGGSYGKHSPQTKRKIAKAQMGEGNSFFEKHHQESIRLQISESMKIVPKWERAKGERHSHAKLSESRVLEIRSLHKTGMILADIAKLYDMSIASIGKITTRQSWKHIL